MPIASFNLNWHKTGVAILDKDTAWASFEQTGNIDAYLLYNKLQNDVVTLSHQEAQNNATKDRRPDNKGNKRR
jgi:hypothetical protein